MVTYHTVEGYQACLDLLSQLKSKGAILLYFAGSINEAGENWCPDCKVAEPIVEDVVKEHEHKTFHFIHVGVGSRDEWKNPKCPFRTDEKFKLTSVPTLMKWNSVARLDGDECQERENIQMMLEEIEETEGTGRTKGTDGTGNTGKAGETEKSGETESAGETEKSGESVSARETESEGETRGIGEIESSRETTGIEVESSRETRGIGEVESSTETRVKGEIEDVTSN